MLETQLLQGCQLGKKPKPPMWKHALASQPHWAAEECWHQMLQQAYNAGFSNKHVGSYRLIQAWSKMHLLRHKTTNPTPTEAVVKFSSKSWAREVTQSQTKKDICPIVTLPAHLQHQGGRVPTKCTYKGTRYFHSQEHQLRYGTEVTTWEIPSGNTQGICRESITV